MAVCTDRFPHRAAKPSISPHIRRPDFGRQRLDSREAHLYSSIDTSFLDDLRTFDSEAVLSWCSGSSGSLTLFQSFDDMGYEKNNFPLLKLSKRATAELSWQRQYNDVPTAWLADIRPSFPPWESISNYWYTTWKRRRSARTCVLLVHVHSLSINLGPHIPLSVV